ncbi:MAG: lysoplasmalogenase, partial [Chitinophagaceae bacterium]|nr:lysoplasmalogenase [Chitinophagaceae bacterium]
MKKINWVILFLLVLTGNIAGMYMNSPWLEKITKPLLMIVMIIYFVSSVNTNSSALKKWIIAALVFSWLGDVLLMFQQEQPIFFLLGLSAFLIAHIFYIIF